MFVFSRRVLALASLLRMAELLDFGWIEAFLGSSAGASVRPHSQASHAAQGVGHGTACDREEAGWLPLWVGTSQSDEVQRSVARCGRLDVGR
ncbi:hypothetical protein IE81DRAFT_326792 [Ceraceosorus guamensis]|uniref:Secreted protein n=1 Tax=Ceraceosorus guamensis TaxID=1522189 RepID=A0A316VSL2_9BASI|nr:hypothetical protein IE81DRAFT_326792 [Ceraceosorus guamensis]PWN39181.1 hypothetical protein IE81DRAFT_326792 [Ceraceosorus guamensis]